MLQGDVGELFLLQVTKTHQSDYYIGLYKQPRQFCETSAEVTNYVIAFCRTMWKVRATEIEF